MTNEEYEQNKRIQKQINFILTQNQTIIKIPYVDIVTQHSHLSKEVTLKGYECQVGKTIRYLDIDWNVDAVKVVGNEIYIALYKRTNSQ